MSAANAPTPNRNGDGGFWSCGWPCSGTLYEPDQYGVQWCDSLTAKHAWKRLEDAWMLVGTATYDGAKRAWDAPVAAEASA